MSKLTALGHIGLAFESSFGTAVAPIVYVPYETIKVEDTIKKVTDEARRGVLTKEFNEYNATREGKVEVDCDVYPELVGYFLKAMLSNYSVTGSAAPYAHKFQVLNALSPSLTLSDYNTVTERQYAGAALEEVQIKFDTEAVAKMSAKFVSKASVVASTTTPAFNVSNPFMGFESQLNIGGTQNLNMVGAELTLKRETKLLFPANNTDQPSKYVTGRIECSGKLTFDIEDESEFQMYLNGTQPTMDIKLTKKGANPEVSIDFSFGKVDFSKANIDRSQEFLRCDVEFKALYNATDNGMTTITLKNAVTTY